MVARPGSYQASNNAGELKAELHGRTDLKQFYGGLAYARNIEPVPQGGSRLSPRTRHLGRIRRPLAALEGALGATIVSDVTAAQVLATITFSAPREVASAAVEWLTATPAVDAILQFEVQVGGVWTSLGAAFAADDHAAIRSASAPPFAPVLATGLRLRCTAAPGAATDFEFSAMLALEETAGLSSARLQPFTFSLDQTYVAAFTDRHVDFYRDGVFVGSSRTATPGSAVRRIDVQQRLDTMLVFSDDDGPCRIVRDGADERWKVDRMPHEAVPVVDLGGIYTNYVTDVWRVYLRVPTADSAFNFGKNLVVNFTVNGEETGGIYTGAPDWVAFASAAKAAIENLASVAPGIDVAVLDEATAVGSITITITFSGEGNRGSRNVVAAQVVNTSSAAATAVHWVTGKPGGEDLMSQSRGWPACGMFYQDRLILAGFKAKRGALLASVTGEYFDYNVELVAESGAILNNLDTDGAEHIQKLARARHLLIFTSEGEYFISDRALTKTMTVVNCSRNGSAPGIDIVESEGQLFYVSRNNALIYAATYDDVASAYVSEPISLLASHIASDIAAMALQRPSTATDAGRLWLPRNDGTMTLGIMLRGENVTSFVRWETAGKVRDVCVDGANVAHILVERLVDGAPELHFERLEFGLLFDDTIEQTLEGPTTIVGNLAALEGAQVWAIADGYVEGPFVVDGSAITLPNASSHVLVGRWTPPLARTLPLPNEINDRIVLRRPKRVHTVKLDLIDTTSIAVGANGRPAREQSLVRVTTPADAPPPPYSGLLPVSGLTGISDEGQVEITQARPGRLAWRGITIEARR